MRILFFAFLTLIVNQFGYAQIPDTSVMEIKAYVKKIDSLNNIKTLLSTKKPLVVATVAEGYIENKTRGLQGGFSLETVTNPNMDTIYLIEHSDNLDQTLTESYYFKNDKLVFSKIELQDQGNETLFLKQDYYKNDKTIVTTVINNRLKRRYKWRISFDALKQGYYYYNESQQKKH